MHDLAKRSLACTVATGGLLLTGAAYFPALAAATVGQNQGSAQAQGVKAHADAASSPLDPASRSGFGLQLPADTFTACDVAVNTAAGSPCARNAEDGSPTVPGAPAAESGGVGAAAVSAHDGGIVTDDPWQTPIKLPAAAPETRCGCAPPAHPTRPTRPARPPRPCGCETPTAPPSGPWTPPTTPGAPPTGPCGCQTPTTPPTGPWTPPTSPSTPPTSPCGCQTPTTPPTSPTTPATAPTTVHTAPPPPNSPPGLAHTGADVGIALGVAGAALIGGLGLRAAARKREGEE